MHIVVYTQKACPHSLAAKVWLSQHNYEFEEVALDEDNELNRFCELHPDLKTLPQIFVDDKNIGGFSDLLRSAL
jgi:glutaredoxin 3